MRRRGALFSVGTAVAVSASMAVAQPLKPYLEAVGGAYSVRVLMSVADQVPLSGDLSKRYQMVGIPDGMGLARNDDGTATLYMNHEFRTDVSTEPIVGEPLHRGAFVSAWTLNADGRVLSGGPAFDIVFDEDTFVGPAAAADNTTPAFGRFCSGMLVGQRHGFDRRIFLTNEEADAPGAFDPRGGSTVAIFDGEAHALPALGHFSKENSLVMMGTGNKTVIVGLEDGPVTPDSQVYLYIGRKQPVSASVLERNGLVGGRLYVLAPWDGVTDREAEFDSGRLAIRWVEIPEAGTLSDVDLEAAADDAGAFGFVRVEDGAFDTVQHNELFFTTTGAPDQGNSLGRVYKLQLNPADPVRSGRLSIVVNSDQMDWLGKAVPLAPDNVGINRDFLMVEEGGNGPSKARLSQLGRDNSIWRFPLLHTRRGTVADLSRAGRIAMVAPPGRDGIAVPPGVWEPSGIIPAGFLGGGAWLTTVQTFPPTVEPAPNTFRDGQLVALIPVR